MDLFRRSASRLRSPRSWSLAHRLGLYLGAVMLIALVALFVLIGWRTITVVSDIDNAGFEGQAHMVAARLAPTADGGVTVPPEVVNRFLLSDGDNLFMVLAADGAMLTTSNPERAQQVLPFVPPTNGRPFATPPVNGHPNGFVGLAQAAGPWRVVVAQGRDHHEVLQATVMRGLADNVVWLLLPIATVTVLVGVLTLRRGLRPLRVVSAAAAAIGPAAPGGRLPADGLPKELMPVVAAANGALDRLDRALQAQRRFVGEAAHAMRTPLAVLMARLDQQPLTADDTAALRGDVDRMGRLVEQLLRMARLDGLPLDVSAPVKLRAVAVEAISALAPLALHRGVELALGDGPATTPTARGNHAALVLALTNLIENALAHAPEGSTVEVELASPATLHVLDRGPGVPADERVAIFERFHRGRRASASGAGLGLAIVAGIAAAHGGTVTVADRAGGGADFVLSLPADGDSGGPGR
jgi:two-component system sensor histidine kinase TctE